MSSLGFPFAIVDGSVRMTTSDADASQSQVMFAIGTQVSERVMRSSWGVDITNTIWAVGGDLEDAIPEAVGLVFTRLFPELLVHSISVNRDPLAPYSATVTVQYSASGVLTDQTVSTQLTLPTSDNQGASS